MQDAIDLHRPQRSAIVAARGRGPGIEEAQVIGAPAFPAGPMPGGKRRGLVQEEQLCVGMGGHHRAPARFELEPAGHPMGMPPAGGSEDAMVVMQDPPIAHQGSPCADGLDGGKWRDAILMRQGGSFP